MSGLRGLRPPKPPDGERRRQAKAYQGAFESVAAVVIASLIGYWTDGYFDSSPAGLLIGVALGFLAMVLRLVRLGRELNMTGEAASPPEDERASTSEEDDEPRG